MGREREEREGGERGRRKEVERVLNLYSVVLYYFAKTSVDCGSFFILEKL